MKRITALLGVVAAMGAGFPRPLRAAFSEPPAVPAAVAVAENAGPVVVGEPSEALLLSMERSLDRAILGAAIPEVRRLLEAAPDAMVIVNYRRPPQLREAPGGACQGRTSYSVQ